MNYLVPILFFVSPFVSATTWYENGEPVENVSFQGSKGDFGAIILMTTDSKKLLENWSMPSAGVHILTAEKVEKGKPIEVLVLFGGCTANDLGHCVSEVDYKILKPDGSIYAKYEKTELWKNKPAFPVGQLGLAVDRIGLIAEESDPLGEYRVFCRIRDLVGEIEFSIYSTFEVVEANKSLHETN